MRATLTIVRLDRQNPQTREKEKRGEEKQGKAQGNLIVLPSEGKIEPFGEAGANTFRLFRRRSRGSCCFTQFWQSGNSGRRRIFPFILGRV